MIRRALSQLRRTATPHQRRLLVNHHGIFSSPVPPIPTLLSSSSKASLLPFFARFFSDDAPSSDSPTVSDAPSSDPPAASDASSSSPPDEGYISEKGWFVSFLISFLFLAQLVVSTFRIFYFCCEDMNVNM